MSTVSISIIGPFAHGSEEQQEARVDAFSPILVYIRCQYHSKPEISAIADLRDASYHFLQPIRFGHCDVVWTPVSHKNILDDILHAIHRLPKGFRRTVAKRKIMRTGSSVV